MAIRRFDVDVTGTSPLLLSNNACSDPLSDAAKTRNSSPVRELSQMMTTETYE